MFEQKGLADGRCLYQYIHAFITEESTPGHSKRLPISLMNSNRLYLSKCMSLKGG